jgi:hypothetical protein
MKGITLKNNDSVEFEHRSNNIAFVLDWQDVGELEGSEKTIKGG